MCTTRSPNSGRDAMGDRDYHEISKLSKSVQVRLSDLKLIAGMFSVAWQNNMPRGAKSPPPQIYIATTGFSIRQSRIKVASVHPRNLCCLRAGGRGTNCKSISRRRRSRSIRLIYLLGPSISLPKFSENMKNMTPRRIPLGRPRRALGPGATRYPALGRGAASLVEFASESYFSYSPRILAGIWRVLVGI